ncbi:MAG: type II secretion system protein [Firmicutes bacterium]|nr:type II secretion system protein [Bacillota bacterium]
MIKNRQNGFTLIEVVATLAILAILIAVAIPNFSGLIDFASEKSAISECRNTVNTAQSLYINNNANRSLVTTSMIKEKSNIKGNISSIEDNDGTIIHLVMTSGKWTVTYCKNWETCSIHSKQYTTLKSDNSTTPNESDSYFYIGESTDFLVNSDGNLATYDFGPYGSTVSQGTIFYWEGNFYYTRDSQYVTNSTDRTTYINNYGVKINRTGFVEPGSTTQPGDLKLTLDGVFIFFPYSRFDGDYADPNYWFNITIN